MLGAGDRGSAGARDCRVSGPFRPGSCTHERSRAAIPLTAVIPSGAPKARRRGIAINPTEGYSLYRFDRDSSPPRALRARSARNDKAVGTIAIPRLRGRFARAALGMTGSCDDHDSSPPRALRARSARNDGWVIRLMCTGTEHDTIPPSGARRHVVERLPRTRTHFIAARAAAHTLRLLEVQQ
jgi:hypothetical protein